MFNSASSSAFTTTREESLINAATSQTNEQKIEKAIFSLSKLVSLVTYKKINNFDVIDRKCDTLEKAVALCEDLITLSESKQSLKKEKGALVGLLEKFVSYFIAWSKDLQNAIEQLSKSIEDTANPQQLENLLVICCDTVIRAAKLSDANIGYNDSLMSKRSQIFHTTQTLAFITAKNAADVYLKNLTAKSKQLIKTKDYEEAQKIYNFHLQLFRNFRQEYCQNKFLADELFNPKIIAVKEQLLYIKAAIYFDELQPELEKAKSLLQNHEFDACEQLCKTLEDEAEKESSTQAAQLRIQPGNAYAKSMEAIDRLSHAANMIPLVFQYQEQLEEDFLAISENVNFESSEANITRCIERLGALATILEEVNLKKPLYQMGRNNPARTKNSQPILLAKCHAAIAPWIQLLEANLALRITQLHTSSEQTLQEIIINQVKAMQQELPSLSWSDSYNRLTDQLTVRHSGTKRVLCDIEEADTRLIGINANPQVLNEKTPKPDEIAAPLKSALKLFTTSAKENANPQTERDAKIARR